MNTIPQPRLLFLLLAILALLFLPASAVAQHTPAPAEPLSHRIDAILNTIHLGPPVPLTGDAEFHRRIYLDLVGRGPTAEESAEFFRRIETAPADRAAIREAVIDDLLSRSEFSRYYAKVLEVMFTERRENIGTLEFREFIRRWLAERRPLNELCTEILAADGTDEDFRAAAGFILNRQADPNLVTRDIGRIFFGRDIQCAQCHDHPLVADYEQSEYFGILSFVNRTYLFTDEKRGNKPFLGEKSEAPLEFASVFRPTAPRSIAQPVLPMSLAMDAEPDFVDPTDAYLVAPEKDKRGVPRYSRRQQLAVLATHPENHAFNRNLANRLWAAMMGQGVVHPVDMHHSENPPASAALLRLLAHELVASQYDLRSFLRQIARSHAWQRSVMVPDLQNWDGPPGGKPALAEMLTQIDAQHAALLPTLTQLDQELSAAAEQLQKAQADVSRLQTQLDDARKRLQQISEQHNSDSAKLTQIRDSHTRQLQLIESLRTAQNEAELNAANEVKSSLDQQLDQQEEVVENAGYKIEGLRNRILALANRKLALGEFVVEARGVQRGIRKRMLQQMDLQADLSQQKSRIGILMQWLESRNRLEQAQASESSQSAELSAGLELRETELVESWRQSFAIRRIRPLNPEQMSSATYFALEMHRPVIVRATEEWRSGNHENPADHDNVLRQQEFVTTAVAVNLWDTVEDLVVTRFAAPAGAPQDSFFATVDQALMIQNDATFQGWLKASDGNLIQRLEAIAEPEQLAIQLYLAVLARMPDPDEVQMVHDLLLQGASERTAVIQELVWGLLASSEFRFSM
ncbi:MAG: hypothetical protein RLZZ436_2826 [Planctomycetota bacterium]